MSTDREECRYAFVVMDDLMSAGLFDEATEIFEDLDIEHMSTTGVIGYMCAAGWPAMHDVDFPICKPFLQRCWVEIRKREGDRTDLLLKGLEP